MEISSVKCDKETLNTFRRLVALKHGKLHGVLGKEFSLALSKRAEELKRELKEAGMEVNFD